MDLLLVKLRFVITNHRLIKLNVPHGEGVKVIPKTVLRPIYISVVEIVAHGGIPVNFGVENVQFSGWAKSVYFPKLPFS